MKRTRTVFYLLAFVWQSFTCLAVASLQRFNLVSYNMENFGMVTQAIQKRCGSVTKPPSPNESSKLKYSPQYDAFSKDLSNWYDPKILDSKINRFLEVIKLMNTPEIIALQELESASNTSTVFETKDLKGKTLRSRLESLGYQYFLVGVQDPDNPVSVTTAFISKIKISSLEPVRITGSRQSTSARDLQAVELRIRNERVVIFNNHWKSKRGGGNEEARVETAKILRKRISQEESSPIRTHIIVLGDLNSAYYEKPMQALGTTYESKRAKENPDLLYNLWYEKNEKDRWETSFSGVKGTLSHIVISSSLLNQRGLHYVPETFKVFGHSPKESEVLMNADGSPYRWQMRFYFSGFHHIGRGYSDHLPLMATFSLPLYELTPLKDVSQRNKEK